MSPTKIAGSYIKDTLIRNVGTGTIPVIKVVDSDYQNNRTLLLQHDHDGRDLQLEYAEKPCNMSNSCGAGTSPWKPSSTISALC